MSARLRAAAIRDRKGTHFATVTAYDATFGRLAEAAGIDVLLVGDSLGNVVLGYESTLSVTLADMERHTGAVARGTASAHVIADLPFMSYEPSDADAVRSAGRLITAGAHSVKLEGGAARAPRIAAIVAADIPVVGHIGVQPKTAALGGGFKRRDDREQLLADARTIAAAGAFALVLEMVAPEVAREITAALEIPTIGIGSGPHCDAQIIVIYDVLGLSAKPPPFVHPYAQLGDAVTAALRAYAHDIVKVPVARTDT